MKLYYLEVAPFDEFVQAMIDCNMWPKPLHEETCDRCRLRPRANTKTPHCVQCRNEKRAVVRRVLDSRRLNNTCACGSLKRAESKACAACSRNEPYDTCECGRRKIKGREQCGQCGRSRKKAA